MPDPLQIRALPEFHVGGSHNGFTAVYMVPGPNFERINISDTCRI
jgi:hypothetical protein